MMKNIFLILIFFLAAFTCRAQVTGSDTVCAGYIYTYNANIAGATSYTWTIPVNWYGLTGQGTSQISVTCNVNAGQVCVEGFDSIGNSLGTQCLTTDLGASNGGGSWTLDPNGDNTICPNMSQVNVTPTLIPTGIGGGCLNGCDGGTLHPNLVWALYTGQNFVGVLGTTMSLGLGTYFAFYVDTTLGCNFPQAVKINTSCGGVAGGPLTILHLSFNTFITQIPNQVCIGDTVLLHGNGISGCWTLPYWTINSGLTAITTVYDMSQFQAIVTGMPASVDYRACADIMNDVFSGPCTEVTTYNVNVINCNASASFQTTNTTICENNCINFTNASANATSYQWSFAGATPDTSTDLNPTNICYSTAGSYDVSLISSNSGHSDTLLLPNYITVVAPPQAAFSAIDTNFCPPHCIGFTNTSSNATSYQWNFQGAFPAASTNANPQSICYNTSGNFEVSLISTNSGCSDTLTFPNYITVNVSPQPSMAASPVSFCPGSCTDFTNSSTNATSYQWSFAGATIDTSTLENPSGICYNNSGLYGVVLVASNGVCTDTLSVSNYITVYPQPSGLSVLDTNDTLIADQGFASYQWYFNGNIIAGATINFYIATSNGDYNIVATDTNGCEVEAAIFNVIVNVETFFSEKGIDIVPNPFTNKFSFHPLNSSSEEILISVMNAIGEKLFEKQTTLKDQEIDLSFLDAGFYLLTVHTDSGVILKKIVKM